MIFVCLFIFQPKKLMKAMSLDVPNISSSEGEESSSPRSDKGEEREGNGPLVSENNKQ